MKKRYFYSDKRLGYSHRFDASFGRLYPILVQFALPGDTWNISHDFTIRTIPQIAPLLSNINAYVATFKVPIRILMKKGVWEAFLSGGDDYANSSKWDDFHFRKVDITKLPEYDPINNKVDGLGTDWDLVFNCIENLGKDGVDSDLIPNELYFQARTFIWDEFFRDENLQKKYYCRKEDDGDYYDDDYRYNINSIDVDISPYSIFEQLTDRTKASELCFCDWGKDYFTSSLPFSQQGPSTKIPLNFLFSNFVEPQDNGSGTPPEYMTFIDKGFFGRGHLLTDFQGSFDNMYIDGTKLVSTDYTINRSSNFTALSTVYITGMRMKIDPPHELNNPYIVSSSNNFYDYLILTHSGTTIFDSTATPNPATNIRSEYIFYCQKDVNGGIDLGCVMRVNFNYNNHNYSFDTQLIELKDYFSYTNASYSINPDTGDVEAPTVDLKVLREGFDIQKFKERVATFAGGRYDEFMLGIFGVNLNSDILGIPEVVSRTKIPILSLEVSQTSATQGSQFLGSMAGKGLAVTSQKMGSIYCKEHSLIISLFYIRPKAEYEQGLRRDLSFETRFDLPFPDLLRTGLEPILRGEILATGNNHDNEVFAFSNKFEYLRRNYNKISGNFRTGRFYSPWGLSRFFSNHPNLNNIFVSMSSQESQGGPTNRIFESLDGDPFLIYVYNRITCKRQLPYNSIPVGVI